MCEILLSEKKCAQAIEIRTFYRIAANKRDYYNKYFSEGIEDNTLTQLILIA